jgi:hypothetical protein
MNLQARLTSVATAMRSQSAKNISINMSLKLWLGGGVTRRLFAILNSMHHTS